MVEPSEGRTELGVEVELVADLEEAHDGDEGREVRGRESQSADFVLRVEDTEEELSVDRVMKGESKVLFDWERRRATSQCLHQAVCKTTKKKAQKKWGDAPGR